MKDILAKELELKSKSENWFSVSSERSVYEVHEESNKNSLIRLDLLEYNAVDVKVGDSVLYHIQAAMSPLAEEEPWRFEALQTIQSDQIPSKSNQAIGAFEEWCGNSLAVSGYEILNLLPRGLYNIVRVPTMKSSMTGFSLGNVSVEKPKNIFDFFYTDKFMAFIYGSDVEEAPCKCQPLLGIPMIQLPHARSWTSAVVFFSLFPPEFPNEIENHEDDCILIVPKSSLVFDPYNAQQRYNTKWESQVDEFCDLLIERARGATQRRLSLQ